MLIMGAHYLPFSHLYGMQIFIPLGAAMWLAGLALGLCAPGIAVVGAWFTGAGFVGLGLWANRQHRFEFGDRIDT